MPASSRAPGRQIGVDQRIGERKSSTSAKTPLPPYSPPTAAAKIAIVMIVASRPTSLLHHRNSPSSDRQVMTGAGRQESDAGNWCRCLSYWSSSLSTSLEVSVLSQSQLEGPAQAGPLFLRRPAVDRYRRAIGRLRERTLPPYDRLSPAVGRREPLRWSKSRPDVSIRAEKRTCARRCRG